MFHPARILALLCLSSGCVFAQTFGEIAGEVKDASGAVIPAAPVTVTNIETSVVRTTTTNDAGIYSFPALIPGTYTAKVEAKGFRPIVKTGIALQVQQTARVDFTVELGQVAETIEVSASAAMLSTDTVTVGTVIENKRIVDLPLNGRNFLQLVSLSPNVSYGFATPGQAAGRQGGTRSSQNISISGMRGTWNHYTLDGIENTDVNFNLYVLLPSVDALQEFKVQTGIYPAEFGRGAAQINVSTKPGTNNFHGTVYEFLRNSALDARPYDFIGTSPQRAPFRWNQYGFTLGGPVWIPRIFNGRNRLFFMSNFEGYKERRTIQGTYTVPTLAMRQGDFSGFAPIYDPATRRVENGAVTASPFAGNQIPRNRFDPVSLKLMEFWPEPNVNTSILRDNFQQPQSNRIDKDQFTQRIDFNENPNSQWFGRYSWTDESTVSPSLRLSGTVLYTKASQYMVSNTRVLSPSQVNEARFGYNTFYNVLGQELGGVRNVVEELGIPLQTPDPTIWGIPTIRGFIGGLSEFGNTPNGPFTVDNGIWQLIDNFSWIAGRHSVRFGGEYRYDKFYQAGNEFARGVFEFNGQYTADPVTGAGANSAADFLLGTASRAEASIALAESDFRAHNLAFYVDDVWRITPRVTLN
ncbi:MAG TPA: carboxypeptidase-like regulatory domain-containing protein, partial [Bryobacteraceae bacterium]|nr:carboxypeptidase-like regulatory domain-containing protein [Bryobacteraceae bacterium]